jgi:hypothetical protein
MGSMTSHLAWVAKLDSLELRDSLSFILARIVGFVTPAEAGVQAIAARNRTAHESGSRFASG